MTWLSQKKYFSLTFLKSQAHTSDNIADVVGGMQYYQRGKGIGKQKGIFSPVL